MASSTKPLLNPAQGSDAPRALHIVLNSVVEDSRVLKCAWSLGNAGWDVIVAGATPFTHRDSLTIGYAKIERLPLKVVLSTAFIAKVLRKLRYYKRRFQARFLGGWSAGIPNFTRGVKYLLPVALDFKPHIIHAHDYTALPMAGALIAELEKMGWQAQLVYDAHEYVPGVAHLTKPLMTAYSLSEREAVKSAAAILSVSEGMNELLIPHLGLSEESILVPEIVANDPLVAGQLPSKRNLRADCAVSASTPLIVYSGAVAPQRGIGTVIEGLRQMPEVHFALIANPESASVKDFVLQASNVADRFHVLPYVPNAELVSYLSGADIGLIPIHHKLNHEISLITKFGEYMQARLPIVVSDVRTMAAEVRRLGNGEVFIAQDCADFVRAVELVLAQKVRYQSAYTEEVLSERSWERQAENLVKIYNRVANVHAEAREPLPFTIS